MEIAFILGGLFLFCTIGFVAIALFIPELVGIQGRKAQEIEAAQRGEPLPILNQETEQASPPSNEEKK
jgi:hypothetical protein